MTRKEKVKKVSQAIYDNTIKEYGHYFKKEEAMSEKASKAASIIEDMNICCKKEVADLISLIIEEPVIVKNDSFELSGKILTALIPIKNTNSHNYRNGEVVILNGCGNFGQSISMPGGGNNIPNNITSLKLPTLEEIENCVDVLFEQLPVVFI